MNSVTLGPEALQDFLNTALNKIQLAIMRGNAAGELEKVAEQYGIID